MMKNPEIESSEEKSIWWHRSDFEGALDGDDKTRIHTTFLLKELVADIMDYLILFSHF